MCLFTASAYHQETWDMKWNLRTLVIALPGHMLTQPREIGTISSTPARHLFFAKLSRYYKCKYCSASHPMLLGDELRTETSSSTSSISTSFSHSNSTIHKEKSISKRPGKYTYPSTVTGDDEKKLQSLSSLTSKKIRKDKQLSKTQTRKKKTDNKEEGFIAPYHPLVKICVLMIPILIHFLIQYFSNICMATTTATGVSTSQQTKKLALFS